MQTLEDKSPWTHCYETYNHKSFSCYSHYLLMVDDHSRILTSVAPSFVVSANPGYICLNKKKSKVMSYYLNGHWDMIEWSYCKFYLYQVFSNIICWCKLNLICRIVISIAGTTGNGFLVLELLIGSKAVKKVIIISFKHKTYTWIAIQKLCHNKLKWHTRNLWKVLWIPKKLLKWTITR